MSPDAGEIWASFLSNYREGQVVTGSVRRTKPYGVFVEFMPGQDGLVHRSQILPGEIVQVNDQLWPGDQVKAIIQRIDHADRRVHLSIADYLRRQKTLPLPSQPLPEGTEEYEAEVQQMYQALSVAPGSIRRILLVEDQGDLRSSLEALLMEAGYEVVVLEGASETSPEALVEPYDLIFMDAHIQEVDGLRMAARILELRPEARIILMSGIPLEKCEKEQLATLSRVSVLQKPFRIRELEGMIDAFEKGAESPSWQKDVISAGNLGFDPIPLSIRSKEDLCQALQVLLKDLMSEAKATAAAIFGMSLLTHEVEMLVAIGVSKDAFERQRRELDISPIKDVIVDGEHILEADAMGRVYSKFKYLLPLLDFSSCIGLPLVTAGTRRYGLFLFHRLSDQFDARSQHRASRIAAAANALIERYQVEQSLRAAQEFTLVGQISAGLAHEVNNRIGALQAQVRLLKVYCQSVGRATSTGKEPKPDAAAKLQDQVEAAAKTVERLQRTAFLFQQLVSPQQGRVCHLSTPVLRAVDMVSTTARRKNVRILLDEPLPELPLVGANDVALEQVFVNLILNPIQQIADRDQDDGWVRIVVREYDADEALPVQVEVRDNGPGIHKRWWDRVFALGFSTRLNGSGLGLFMARSLVESFGGSLTIEESIMLAGTTFVVALPAAGGANPS